MRGGLVAALAAVRALGDPVLLTADEEHGSVTSEELIVTRGREAAAALIPEPSLPSGGIKTTRKGAAIFRFEVTGVEAHAGSVPGRGVSAVHELASLVVHLQELARPEVGTTINVGVVGGGTRSNVVAGQAWAEIDVRVKSVAEYERLAQAFRELVVSEGATLAVRCLHARPPMERTPAIAAAAKEAKRIGALLGLELAEGPAGGASDGNFLAPLGVPVVDGLGPQGGGAHAVDEHIIAASLDQRVALIALLIALL
jgi:glutamate carboxypeptidase